MLLKSGKLFFVYFFLGGLILSLVTGCNSKTSSEQTTEQAVHLVKTPLFNADSAYAFVQKQVAFGPRVPNTTAHRQCGDFLTATLKGYGLTVTEQSFIATTYDGKKLNARNIIGSFNPKASKRIMLAAHWDSRPFADEDSLHKSAPVPAANDGASGVGVLLEIARVISSQDSLKDLGVDILLFDAEDWGNSDQSQDKYGGYCLGSQYWASNKHQPGYTAYFGILLDMVGAKGAVFPQEGFSVQMAESVVRDVWQIAGKLGYSNFFIDQRGSAITDDHVPVNEVAKIPMIDIIHTQPNNLSHTFFDAWHTTRDTMENIDPKTLKAVGQTLIQVLFQEGSPEAL
jgi:glutaminyl-peptide cyclotransferase